MSRAPLSQAGLTVLRSLARAGRGRSAPDPAIVADLVSQGLIVPKGRHATPRLTEAGRAALAAQTPADGVDAFRRQHLRLEPVRISEQTCVLSNAAESPLVWLARRKGRDGRPLIDATQLLAGERLRADFTRAQMAPRVTSRWDGAVGASPGAALTYSDVVLLARQTLRAALDAVGPEFSGLLLDVCCFLKGLDDVERERGWPARSGKLVLQLGLDRLARHYGYAAQACGPHRQAIRAWEAPDAP